MKKWFLCIFVLLSVMFFCVGCNSNNKLEGLSDFEKIQLRLTELESYVATADVVRFSNKGDNKYNTVQYYKISGEYRIDFKAPKIVEGNIIVFDGNCIKHMNPRINGSVFFEVPESAERDEIFLGSFIKNYLQSENVSIQVSAVGDSTATVLEAVIPGDNFYMSTEKLWMDNNSLNPVKLIIYDKDGKERTVVTYEKFDYNVELDENLFKTTD